MLLPSDTVLEQMNRLSKRIPKNPEKQFELAHKMHEVDPQNGITLMILAMERIKAGEWAQAEDLLWKTIKFRPIDCEAYLQLGALRGARDLQDPLPRHLLLVSLRHVPSLTELPELAARHVKKNFPPELDLADPEVLGLCIQQLEQAPLLALNPEDEKRLLPLRVLSELHWTVRQGYVQASTVDTFAAHSKACSEAGLWALRSWARYGDEIDPDAIDMIVAMLGEFGESDVIEDLWDIVPESASAFAHLQWALCKLGDRFPAEAAAEIRKRAATKILSIRCVLADQLSMMPRRFEVADAFAALLENFAGLEGDADDLSYLLAAVYEGLSDQGEIDKAETLLQQYKPLLSDRGRERLDELLFSAEGFVPSLQELNVKEIPLSDVFAGALSPGDEFEEDGEESDGDFDGDWDNEPVEQVFASPRPGRNDPCWCGSGKKYKKCHLETDEPGN